LKTKKKKS